MTPDTETPTGDGALTSGDSNTPIYYVYWEKETWDGHIWTPHVTTDVTDIHVCENCGQPLCPRYHKPHHRRAWEDVDTTTELLCDSCAGDDERGLRGKRSEWLGTDKLPGEVYHELGKVQKAVLCAMDDLVFPEPYHALESAHLPKSDVSEHPYWCNRTAVSRKAAERYYQVTSANAATSAISRAVSSLLDRGLILGAFKGWVRYYGDPETNPMYTGRYGTGSETALYTHGETPDGGRTLPERTDDESIKTRRPTLELLGFRFLGRETAALIKEVDEIAADETAGGGDA